MTDAPRVLRALLIEDSADDADLAILELGRAGFDARTAVVDNETDLREALLRDDWDVVLCDHNMPGFDDVQALAIVRALRPGLPLIIVSGQIGEEAAVTAMRHGARDYVSKDRLAGLGPAVERTLREVQTERERAGALAALHESEARFEAIVETTLDGMALCQAVRDEAGAIVDFRFEYVNAACCRMLRMARGEPHGRLTSEILPDWILEERFEDFRRLVETGEPLHFEVVVPFARNDGTPGELALDVRSVKLGDGYAASARNISERRRAELERERLHARLARVYGLVIAAHSAIVRAETVEDLYDGVCRAAVDIGGFAVAWVGLLDRDGEQVRPVAACGTGGYLDVLGRAAAAGVEDFRAGPTTLAAREGRPVIWNDIATQAPGGRWGAGEEGGGIASSAAFPLHRGDEVIGALSVHSTTPDWFSEQESGLLRQLADDVSLAIHARQQEGELRNTERFLEALTDSMNEGMFALDQQGRVTYTNRAAEELLGWSRGELRGRILHEVAHAGDEDGAPHPPHECPLLGVVAGGPAVTVDDDVFARRDGGALPVAFSASPMVDHEEHGVVVVFSDISARKAEERRRLQELETLSWVGRIREALDEHRLVLYAQPIVDVRTREVVSHELLLRMIDARGTVIEPGAFLPAAERFGLIGEIDLWVLQQAAAMAAAGRRVNFNLSGDSLGRRDLMSRLARVLEDAGADPGNLVCEVTETAIATDRVAAETSVQQLVQSGCAIALDDFGTGYGSFTFLKRLPVRHIKIDMDFVRNLAGSTENQHVVQAIVNLAHGFDQKTTAEGVEDAETLALLAEFGVDYAQGYAIGRPAPWPDPVDEVERAATTAGPS